MTNKKHELLAISPPLCQGCNETAFSEAESVVEGGGGGDDGGMSRRRQPLAGSTCLNMLYPLPNVHNSHFLHANGRSRMSFSFFLVPPCITEARVTVLLAPVLCMEYTYTVA